MSRPNDIRALTEAYVAAFDSADLKAISALLHPEFSLTDPSVLDLKPRKAVLEFIDGIFKSVDRKLEFTARNILVDRLISVIEFDLKLGDMHLDGVDVIEWNEGGQMIELRAHLTDRANR